MGGVFEWDIHFNADGGQAAALTTSYNGGAVMGLSVGGLGLFGISLMFYFTETEFLTVANIAGFGMGASSIALFAIRAMDLAARPSWRNDTPTQAPCAWAHRHLDTILGYLLRACQRERRHHTIGRWWELDRHETPAAACDEGWLALLEGGSAKVSSLTPHTLQRL